MRVVGYMKQERGKESARKLRRTRDTNKPKKVATQCSIFYDTTGRGFEQNVESTKARKTSERVKCFAYSRGLQLSSNVGNWCNSITKVVREYSLSIVYMYHSSLYKAAHQPRYLLQYSHSCLWTDGVSDKREISFAGYPST